MVMVRIVSDMEPFMGVDGRIYHLKAEDVVTLPERNAGVLIDRNIALNIIPGK
jgi:DNA replication factor GINS